MRIYIVATLAVLLWLLPNFGAKAQDDAAPKAPLKVAPVVVQEPSLRIGQPIPNLLATDIDGRSFDLRNYAAGSPVVVALTSTSCPLCKKYGPTLAEIESEYRSRGVKFVFVGAIASDTLVAAQEARDRLQLQGPYLLDRNLELVQQLQANSTTEVFLLDSQLQLRYWGAVDDQYGLGYTKPAAQHQYLRDALEQFLGGQSIAVSQTSAPGCSLTTELANRAGPWEYHRDIQRIVQNRCQTCHRQEGVAPFALETREELISHAGMVAQVVSDGIMPPWSAKHDPEQPHLWVNDAGLTQLERTKLLDWLKSDHLAGDPSLAPVPRVFDSQWGIGEPNLLVQLPQRNRVRSSGYMDYIHQRIPLTHAEDLWIEAVEIRPTAPEVVHHVLVYAIPRGSRELQIDERSHFLAAYAPGNQRQVFPEGFAKKLPGDHDLVAQMHYTPNGTATFDQTQLGFRVSTERPKREIHVTGIANTGIMIPAGAANHAEVAELIVPRRAQMTAFFPHMHLRGKAFRFELQRAGQSVETLLDVPRYDFNWQLEYRLLNPIEVSVGDRILVTGWFDNSAENPANPNPNEPVRWGPQTFQEMLIGYLEYYYVDDQPERRRPQRSRRNGN